MKAKPRGGWKVLAFLAALSAIGPTDAEADMLWHWSYLDAASNIKAAGTLTTKDLAENSYAITAITGVWNGAPILGLEPLHSCCSPPGWNNNLLLKGEPKLDKGGFAFDVSEGSKINLFYKDGHYPTKSKKAPKYSAAFSPRRQAETIDESCVAHAAPATSANRKLNARWTA